MFDYSKEAISEFVKGAAFTLLVTGVAVGFVVALGEFDPKPASKFEVMDHYGGDCAVVRYRPEGRAQDVFFLDCTNAHLRQ